ncbi:MAG TPA: PD-(D/E)XK nuclease family transposase [Candidatus Eisenbergiella merdipullorum]|uniref:PD-(D/E)XK nuclease family transposase n=1 Tax=Candidatus Eisenbergiella merdipullorum TaxID=2838553 RepID=A0A9D2I7K8_9FIRM|nr:PD-(D/E)XK nuclease family transposase [Candidatus Eisenbergiella merdipullorum]
MENTQKNNGRLRARDRLMEKVKEFTLLSDVFLSVALRDEAACQHVLRLLTGKKELKVKAVRSQYRISKIISHDAILDILAEDEKKRLYNLEIQRRDTVDHSRRTRFYGAMIDSESLEKGKEYKELAEVYIFYISETDIWEAGRTVYPVKKYLGVEGAVYDDGQHVIYVNAEVDDGSETAALMRYFKTADPEDKSHGALSDRVRFLKCEEGGREIMCEVTEKIYAEGREEGMALGRTEEARKTALNMAGKGYGVDVIAELIEMSAETVRQWLENGNRVPG